LPEAVYDGLVRFKRGHALSIIPTDYAPNEAWLVFELNEAPVRTEQDGDFDVLAVMDVATGVILGMEFVGLLEERLPEFASRRLLASAESEAGRRPQRLFLESAVKTAQTAAMANALGIDVEQVSNATLHPLTREAREGFAARVSGGPRQ
jgi:hypothetical protein